MPECNCSTYPFKPEIPCYNICTGRVLNYASPEELIDIFNIRQELVDKIREINREGRTDTLDSYRSALSKEEFGQLDNIFRNLRNNKSALKWLNEKLKNRLEQNISAPI